VEPLTPVEVEHLSAPALWVEDWVTIHDGCAPAHPDNAADGLAALATQRAEAAVVRGCLTGDLPRQTYLASRSQRLRPRWRNREDFMRRWHEARWNASGAPGRAS